MLNRIKRSIGLKIFLTFSAVLGSCIFFVVAFNAVTSRDFGQLVIAENERYVRNQALDFLTEITEQRARKYEAVFQKLSAYSRSIARQAELRFQVADARSRRSAGVAATMTRYPGNGLYYTPLSAPAMICYWGGPTIPAAVAKEIDRLAPMAPVLAEAKESNPEVAASHMILTSGVGHYYPNGQDVYLLPPVSELDLRDTNNYVLADPEHNPERRTVWVPVYFDDVGNGLITTVTTPIYGEDGEFYGVAGLDVPLAKIHTEIIGAPGNEPEAKDLFSFLLNGEGKFISFPVERLPDFGIESGLAGFRNSFDLLNRGLADSSLSEVRALDEKLAAAPSQTFRFQLRDAPYIVASRVMPTTGWRLVTLIPEKTFLSPIGSIAATLSGRIDTLKTEFYLVGLVFLLASVVLTVLFLERFLLRPLRRIATAAEEIRQGNLDIRIELDRSDEIGRLANSFDVMAASLRQGKELEQNYAQELERQVAAQTVTLLQQKKVLRETLLELEADIRRRQEIEEELKQARDEAEAANLAKSHFLANMTHELRTPLIGVLGMNELLLQTPLSDRQRYLAVTVQRSGETLLALINDILDFSKIESGYLSLDSAAADIGDLVEETTLMLADKAFEKGLTLLCRVAPEARWQVSLDPLRFRQIVLNLLSNAVKFTPQGHVAVRLEMTPQGAGAGCFTLTVEDTGIGLRAEDRQTIFKPFAQIDSTATRAFGGTGLGLSIVRQLVDAMGGRLQVESRPGEGSRFAVALDLPLLSCLRPQLAEPLTDVRVLVQSEHPGQRTALEEMLAFLGASVVPAATAGDGWQRLLDADRDGIPFDIALIAFAGGTPENGRLPERIAVEPRLAGLRTIILCPRRFMLDSSFSAGLELLEEPVTWHNLLAALGPGPAPPARASSPAAAEGGAPPRKAAGDGGGEETSLPLRGSVLVVDDYPSTRELIRNYFKREGLAIDEATSGFEALELTGKTTYKMILMDCNMPQLDGLETTRRLRRQGYAAPIVAMTAHVDSRIYQECRAAGMDDHLRKPFKYRELKAIMDRWLSAEGAEASARAAAESSPRDEG